MLSMVLLGVDLFVFLEILRTLERFLANLADMGFQRSMD